MELARETLRCHFVIGLRERGAGLTNWTGPDMGGVINLTVTIQTTMTGATMNGEIGTRFSIRERFEGSVESANWNTAGYGVDTIRRPGVPGKTETIVVLELDERFGHLMVVGRELNAVFQKLMALVICEHKVVKKPTPEHWFRIEMNLLTSIDANEQRAPKSVANVGQPDLG
jgi:hypothetical protein